MFVRLNEEQAKTLLTSGGLGRLGCIVDGGPYIVPINYYFENGCAYSHSLPGVKITALRENPEACLQVDEIEGYYRWVSVLAFGKFEEIVNESERKTILTNLLKRFPSLTPVESVMAQDAGPPPIIVFRIRIDRLTGVAEE
ncbi:MAG TPA: pyridoxamine 5'-phosphate oxidase family protein [Pyrinomonadaceae bacterium]|nr:pyridoxamine 5'-phosphate oxidase family protein [Pyrinomonadaceae bacterium]HLE61759.1 pyridoxamine 5'-phosphate oxidase family protein [Pyrinomonadaceae bacterium]